MNVLSNKKRILAAAMAVLIAAPSFAGVTTTEKDKKGNELNYESLDPFYNQDNGNNPMTFKIYDYSDNLVYESTLTKDDVAEVKLIKLLNKSDFMAENGNTSYFRLNH